MLDKICTDLETSKRLKELGVEIKSSTFWCLDDNPFIVVDDAGMKGEYECQCYFLEQILSELGKAEYLSTNLTVKLRNNTPCFDYEIGSHFPDPDSPYWQNYERTEGYSDNLATTAARLLIKLIEEKK